MGQELVTNFDGIFNESGFFIRPYTILKGGQGNIQGYLRGKQGSKVYYCFIGFIDVTRPVIPQTLVDFGIKNMAGMHSELANEAKE